MTGMDGEGEVLLGGARRQAGGRAGSLGKQNQNRRILTSFCPSYRQESEMETQNPAVFIESSAFCPLFYVYDAFFSWHTIAFSLYCLRNKYFCYSLVRSSILSGFFMFSVY